MASQAFAVEYGKPIETAVPVSWGVGSSPDPTPRAMNRLSDALSEVEGAIADSLARAEAIATKMLGPEPPSNPQLAEASDPRRGFMGVRIVATTTPFAGFNTVMLPP